MIIYILFALVNSACINPVSPCDPSIDYFPKSQFNYARSISNVVNRKSSLAFVVSYPDPQTGSQTQKQYTFVRCGCAAPINSTSTVIMVPVNSTMIQLPSSAAKAEALGQLSSLQFVEDGNSIGSNAIYNAIKLGSVKDLQYQYGVLSTQLPDVLITGPGSLLSLDVNGNKSPNPSYYGQTFTPGLEALRLIDTDSIETSPLGRAELLLLHGYLYDVPQTANDLFSNIVLGYNRVKTKASVSIRRPFIAQGFGNAGNWTIVSRTSYIGLLLQDSNVDFIGSEDLTESSLTSDQWSNLFGQASMWIDVQGAGSINSPKSTIDALLNGKNAARSTQGDYLFFSNLLSIQCFGAFSNDAMLKTSGNSFFSMGTIRPDLVLADFVHMFHPEQPGIGGLTFYRRLASQSGSFQSTTCPFQYVTQYPTLGSTIVRASFTVRGISSTIFSQLIPVALKPQLSQIWSFKNKLDCFVQSVSPDSFEFTIAVRTSRPEQAYQYQTVFSRGRDTVISLIQGGIQPFLSANSAGLSLLKNTTDVSRVTVEQGPLYTLHGDSGPVLYTPNLFPGGLTGGQVAGIAVGSILFFFLSIVVMSYCAFKCALRNVYRKLDRKMPPKPKGPFMLK